MYCTIWSQINVIYYSLIIFFSSGLLNTVTGSLSQWMTVLVNRINECKMSELERSWKIRHHYFLMNFHEHANVYLWIKTHTNCCVSSLTFRILGRSTFLCTFLKIFLWFFFFLSLSRLTFRVLIYMEKSWPEILKKFIQYMWWSK